jgi:hypothetical protein
LIIRDRGGAGLVIGWPLTLAGADGPRTQSLRQADLTRLCRGAVVDRGDAAYILQGSLDHLARTACPPRPPIPLEPDFRFPPQFVVSLAKHSLLLLQRISSKISSFGRIAFAGLPQAKPVSAALLTAHPLPSPADSIQTPGLGQTVLHEIGNFTDRSKHSNLCSRHRRHYGPTSILYPRAPSSGAAAQVLVPW